MRKYAGKTEITQGNHREFCFPRCGGTMNMFFVLFFTGSDLHTRDRLLQERLGSVLPPYIRAEMHSHNHQHVHQHNHNHTHLPSQQPPPPTLPGSGVNPLTPPAAGLLTPSLSHLVSEKILSAHALAICSIILCRIYAFTLVSDKILFLSITLKSRDGSVYPVSWYRHKISCRPW